MKAAAAAEVCSGAEEAAGAKPWARKKEMAGIEQGSGDVDEPAGRGGTCDDHQCAYDGRWSLGGSLGVAAVWRQSHNDISLSNCGAILPHT